MNRRSDYHFDLPPAQIAQQPAERRDASRLLVVGDELTNVQFTELPARLPREAVVIVNDTRVVPARVHTHKDTGGAVELLFIEPVADAAPAGQTAWRCLARARRPLRAGQTLHLDYAPGTTIATLSDRAEDGSVLVAVPGDGFGFLDAHGELPLPPYIARETGPAPADRERYQTIYAKTPGAVAAPTAGLHVTPAVLAAFADRGITVASVTLHVGLGTFAPIRDDDLSVHVMHSERYVVPADTAALIASGRPIVAIGTTVVRTLESAALGPRQVAAGPGVTSIFIRPGTGFRFQIVDHLVTNFHLPESTLLMLVCTFAGVPRVMSAYAHAVAGGYRFFSYGDAMLLARCEP